MSHHDTGQYSCLQSTCHPIPPLQAALRASCLYMHSSSGLRAAAHRSWLLNQAVIGGKTCHAPLRVHGIGADSTAMKEAGLLQPLLKIAEARAFGQHNARRWAKLLCQSDTVSAQAAAEGASCTRASACSSTRCMALHLHQCASRRWKRIMQAQKRTAQHRPPGAAAVSVCKPPLEAHHAGAR